MSETKFFYSQNIVQIGADRPSTGLNELLDGTYIIRVSQEGFYLEKVPDFTLPEKVYSDIVPKAQRILNTFKQRPTTTGVLLSGEKGSGKTLLTKVISTIARNNHIPTIIVNQAYTGDEFNLFLQKIVQPCVLLFDEFEKVYDAEEQKALLTLFDGVLTTKKLILLTSNNYKAVDEHMKNRPGRIYYSLSFKGLDTKFVKEYAQDNLKNQSFINQILILSKLVKTMNFDVLQAVIEESNRYDESPLDSINMLNVEISDHYYEPFTLTVTTKEPDVTFDEEMLVNPFRPFCVSGYKGEVNNDGDYKEYPSYEFSPSNFISMDIEAGKYVFTTDAATVILTRKTKASTTSQIDDIKNILH